MASDPQKLTAEDCSPPLDLASGAVQSATAAFDPKLCYKLDFKILTPMFFLNFLSLMGRTNIGAALIQGLPDDLGMGSMQTFLVIVIPVVMLILFEVPSNLLMRWLERRAGLPYMRYLSLVTVVLGVVTLGQAFDRSYGALLATRFLVGIVDSAVMPGCVFVLSLYYPATHLQWRLSMLVVSNIVSNVLSNILAFGIAQIDSANGWHGWRWIFLIEGLLTITIGLACVGSNIGRPETATFLSEPEKAVIAATVESRKSTIGIAAEVRVFLSNPLSYLWSAIMVFTVTTISSVAVFAPSFIKAFHGSDWTVPRVQGQVAPIFVVAAALCLMVGWAADRLNHRCGFALFGYVLAIIGYAILRETKRFTPNVQLLALYLACMGTYTSMAMLWALTCLNAATPFQKAFGSAFVIGVGNAGNFVSAWIFRSSEAPRYTAGMTAGLVLTCVAAGLMVVTWGYIGWYNRRNGSAEIRGLVVWM
ncbi:hypothetical protein PG988_011376 [Apiospora saccharicola]